MSGQVVLHDGGGGSPQNIEVRTSITFGKKGAGRKRRKKATRASSINHD